MKLHSKHPYHAPLLTSTGTLPTTPILGPGTLCLDHQSLLESCLIGWMTNLPSKCQWSCQDTRFPRRTVVLPFTADHTQANDGNMLWRMFSWAWALLGPVIMLEKTKAADYLNIILD